MNPIHKAAYFVSNKNRERKWRHFLSAMNPTSETSVLDVGYQDLAFFSGDNYIEEHYAWPSQITALGIENHHNFTARYPDVTVVMYDGTIFPFADKTFDVVWSNAVIEHVGDRDAQLRFLSECLRVGERVFLTTPNRYFPIEVHTRIPFLHWLPKRYFDRILRLVGKGFFAGGYMNLLSHRELAQLLNEVGSANTRIVRNRLFGPTLDFVVVTEPHLGRTT